MSEQIILTEHADAAMQDTHGKVVTGQRLIVDGDRDTEATVLSPFAGASSDAPANSGIPSAMTQHRLRREAFAGQRETPMADHRLRTHDDSTP